jgi:hypothetical protein
VTSSECNLDSQETATSLTEFGLWSTNPAASGFLAGSQLRTNAEQLRIQTELQQQQLRQQLGLAAFEQNLQAFQNIQSNDRREQREEEGRAVVAQAGHVAPREGNWFTRLFTKLFGPEGRDTSQCRDTS